MSGEKDMETDKIRVLLVDDEEELIEYLSKRLLREGFTVRAVTSGEAAMRLVQEEDFDVAVVDLKMPGMDGIQTQYEIHRLRPQLQCVVLTGHGSYEAALESGKQKAFRFLQKPAEHDELVRAIREAAEVKQNTLMEQFRREMEEITRSGGSPREVLAAVEDLRKKFGLP